MPVCGWVDCAASGHQSRTEAISDGLLRILQDVPRTADHAASRTLYTWRVDAAAVTRRVGEELLQTAANLRARLHRELTEHGEARPSHFYDQ